MADRLEVTCPCCTTKLVVDATSGEILAEERPKLDADKSFEQAFQEVKGGTQRREAAFSKAFDRTQRLDDLLNKKFEEARKKAATDKTKPRNPFESD
jgi:hypothetical protein